MERRNFVRAGLALGTVVVAAPLGTTPLAGRAARRRATPIRLSSNENPLGLAPGARRAVIDAIPDANRYPGGSVALVLDALARHHDVPRECLVLGAGSSEVLQMAVQAFGHAGARFIVADPTFEDVPSYAATPWNLALHKVPLRPDHSHDLARMRALSESSASTAVVYLCNPNNPTGTLTSSAAIDAWVRSAPDHVHFLIDEAYIEYAEGAEDYWSALGWIADNRRVMVARTFSKVYGMAGMRLGYGLAHPDTAARLRDLQSHNNVNHLALMAGLASLRDEEHVARSLDMNRRARRAVTAALDDLGLDYLPSHTNFVMHRIRGDLTAYIDRMREEGMLVGRPFPPMLEYNRLSLSTPEDMEAFLEVLRGFRERGWV